MENHLCLKFVLNYDFLLIFLTSKTTACILEFARTFIKISHGKKLLVIIEFPMGAENTFKLRLKFIWKSFFDIPDDFLSPGFCVSRWAERFWTKLNHRYI